MLCSRASDIDMRTITNVGKHFQAETRAVKQEDVTVFHERLLSCRDLIDLHDISPGWFNPESVTALYRITINYSLLY